MSPSAENTNSMQNLLLQRSRAVTTVGEVIVAAFDAAEDSGVESHLVAELATKAASRILARHRGDDFDIPLARYQSIQPTKMVELAFNATVLEREIKVGTRPSQVIFDGIAVGSLFDMRVY